MVDFTRRIWGCTLKNFWSYRKSYNTMCDYRDAYAKASDVPAKCKICTNGGCVNKKANNYDKTVLTAYSRKDKCVFKVSAPIKAKYEGTIPAGANVDGSEEQEIFKGDRVREACLLASSASSVYITASQKASLAGTETIPETCDEFITCTGVTFGGEASGRRRRLQAGTATVALSIIPSSGSAAAIQASVANAIASDPSYGTVELAAIEYGGCMTATAASGTNGCLPGCVASDCT